MPVPQGKTVHILFVCLGNICRSPMAEAIMRRLVVQAGLSSRISVDSCGTSGYHIGESPHSGTRRVLREHGIAYTHSARTISAADFAHADYLVALDRSNLADLRAYPSGTTARMGLLLDYSPDAGMRDVPDPYYDGRFDEVYVLIEQACRGLLEHIIAKDL